MHIQKEKLLSIEVLTKNVKKLIVDASSKCANKESQRKSSRMPLLVGKKIRHIFQEDSYVGKVISTVPGFPEFYNIIYDCELDSTGNDCELDSTGNVCETTAIYTYRLLDDYRAKKLEIIPEVVRLKDVEVVPEYLVLLKCTESA
jgi:hypothetical protein